MPNNTSNAPPFSTTGLTGFSPSELDPYLHYISQTNSKIKKKVEEEEMATPQDARPGFTFGCDPELFVFNPEGKPVPADMIPGTKIKPHKVDRGAVQRDGFAAEFNIEPVTTFADFNSNIEKVMKQLEAFLPQGYTLRPDPAVTFDKDVFDAAPDSMKELGCLPDMDAWTGDITPAPSLEDQPYLRCSGGHIHIGFPEGPYSLGDSQHVMNCRDLVRQLDWYLGGWSLKFDADPTRRKLYGRAGACRIKPYGVEYRVLSSFWVTSRERRLQVWNRMQTAIRHMASQYMPDRAGENNALLVESINTSVKHPELYAIFRHPLTSLMAY